MSRKIILIENRPSRQKIYLPNQEKDQAILLGMDFVTHYISDSENIKQLINSRNYNFLLEFDLIMVHRSFLNEISTGSAVNALAKFCEHKQKDLIYFSGGISASSFVKQDDFNFLLINSRDFYSNLLDFLIGYNKGLIENLLELKYGKSWKLSYLLRLREFEVLISLNEKIDASAKREIEELLTDEERKNLDDTIDLILNGI